MPRKFVYSAAELNSDRIIASAGLLQQASVELGEPISWHPALRADHVTVGKAVPLAEAKVRIDERKTPAALIHNRHFDRDRWRSEARHPKVVAYDFGRFLGRHATAEVTGANCRRTIVAQLVAHNAEFDGTFLREWFERLGLFLPASYRVFCTVQRAMWLFHENRSLTPPRDFKLATLCQYFGISFPAHEAHDALVDVRVTVELYRRMNMLGAARLAQSLDQPASHGIMNGCG